MTDQDGGELYQPLLDELERYSALLRESVNLRGHEEAGIRTLRHALHTVGLQHVTFDYLAMTSTEFTVPLVDDLVEIACSGRYTNAMQELLGRLTYQQQLELVPPAVFKVLESEHPSFGPPDEAEWRQMGVLLYRLGLYDALRELIRRARDHIDGGVREAAEDFSELVTHPSADPEHVESTEAG